MTLGADLQRLNGLRGIGIWAVSPAPLQVLKTFSQLPVEKALGRKGNLSVFHIRFQKVADLHMDLLADVLRYHDLKLGFYGYDMHVDVSGSSTVEQYNFGQILSIGIQRLQVHRLRFRSHSGSDEEHNLITPCAERSACVHRKPNPLGSINGSTSLTVTSQSMVALAWNASTSQGVVGYNVYRSMTSGGPYTKGNSNLIATTSYSDLTVQSGLTYYYVTTAVDSQGMESAYSNQAVATVP
jgi:hypothetical protein